MVTISNYFECTVGTFKIQPTSWAEKCVAAINVAELAQGQLVLGNRQWIPNFVSYSERWGSLSAYWISEDGQYLLRVSDHWSAGPVGVHRVGYIRQCWWELTGRKQPGANGFWVGIVRLGDLKERC